MSIFETQTEFGPFLVSYDHEAGELTVRCHGRRVGTLLVLPRADNAVAIRTTANPPEPPTPLRTGKTEYIERRVAELGLAEGEPGLIVARPDSPSEPQRELLESEGDVVLYDGRGAHRNLQPGRGLTKRDT